MRDTQCPPWARELVTLAGGEGARQGKGRDFWDSPPCRAAPSRVWRW